MDSALADIRASASPSQPIQMRLDEAESASPPTSA
jgi:hypothetical protein